MQAAIVKQLRQKRSLISIFVFIHNSCDTALAQNFQRSIKRAGWIVSSTSIYYPDLGDSVADKGLFFVGIHKGATNDHAPIRIAMPPLVRPQPLASFYI